MMKNTYLGLTFTVIVWGSSFVATKIALREMTPAVIAFLRFTVGVVVLLVLLLRRAEINRFKLNDLPALSLLGILGITSHQLLQANGLLTASASVTSWIVATIPVYVALLGWIFLREEMTALRVTGIILSTMGVLVVVGNGNFNSLIEGGFGTPGDRLIALSAVNWSVFIILNKHLFNKDANENTQSSVGRMFVIMTIGWLFIIPWVIVDGGLRELHNVSLHGWLALAFLGVFCSGVAYFLWFHALEQIDATQASVFLYLEPIVTVIFAGIILGEPISFASLVGGAAILLGVWLVNRKTESKPALASLAE
jgi:drug/metabolite transporter (DMT)-like permease